MTKQSVRICIDPDPNTDTGVFRIEAADDILRLLADAHDSEFTIPELVDTTDVARSTVWRAIDLLESIDAVDIRETPQRNYVSINPDNLKRRSHTGHRTIGVPQANPSVRRPDPGSNH